MKLIALILTSVVGIVLAKDCGDGKIRGVNLGGWLLLEPWISPKVFEEVNVGENLDKIVDEYTYAQYVDPEFAATRLERHFDEWYTKDDLAILANAGINYLRIPVGYWMFDVAEGEPFPPPSTSDDEGRRFYLKRLVGWAQDLNMRIMMDLHGAPGSQNGFDNSGRRGDVHWVEADGSDNHENVDRTILVLTQLAQLMRDWMDEGFMREETLYGIELLNEPFGTNYPHVWTECRDHFNYEGYEAIRRILPNPKFFVSIQQAFVDSSEFIGYMPEPEYQSVSLDMHVYHGFSDYWNLVTEKPDAWQLHLQGACDYINEVTQQTLDTYSGEWSLAITDCQKYVNGGYGNPYVPTYAKPTTCEIYNSDWSTYTEEYKMFLKDFMLAQLDSAEAGQGFFFWTAKTEENCAPEWDMIYLIQNGIAPSDFCTRETYCPQK